MRSLTSVLCLLLWACEPSNVVDAGAGGGGGGGAATGGGGATGGGLTGGGAGGGAVSCTSVCDETQVCEDGSCVGRALNLTWSSPGDGALAQPGPVLLRAFITPFPGRPQQPPAQLSATLTAPDGGVTTAALVMDASGYSSSVMLTRGSWSARTSYGALVARQTFQVGAVPTVLAVDVSPVADAGVSTSVARFEDFAWPNSHRRDAHVTVRVRATAGEVEPGSLSAAILSGGQRTVLAATTCPTNMQCITGCACFDADLSVPRLDAFRGEFALEASGRDSDGQPVLATNAPTIRVTRWMWGIRFFTTTSGFAEGPYAVLDSRGRAIVAYRQGASAVTASLDVNGRYVWQSAAWTQSTPVVGEWPDAGEVVFLPNFGEAIRTTSTTTGAAIETASPTALFGVEREMSLAPMEPDGGTRILLGVTYAGDPSSPELFAYGPGVWNRRALPGANLQIATAGDGLDLFYAYSDLGNRPSLTKRRFSGTQWSTVGDVSPPIAAGHLVPSDGGVIIGALFANGASWLRWPVSTAIDWTYQTPNAGGTTGFVMPTSQELIGARATNTSSELVRLRIGDSSPAATRTLPAASAGAPALAADGLVFVTTVGGHLLALDRGSLATRWQETFGNESFESSPLLDCARDATGQVIPGRPGRVILVGRAGRAYSVIIDGHGVDTTSPWPLAFHDPANTNNAQTPLGPFACP